MMLPRLLHSLSISAVFLASTMAASGQVTTEISAYPNTGSDHAADGRVQYILSQQVAAGSDRCDACSCGCGAECRQGDGCPHPWRTGPGWCDDWCVGPHWDVSVDGLILHRENLDLAGLEALWGQPVRRFEQFGYEVGARAYATAYTEDNCRGYGVQLGYVGVDRWRADGRFTLPGIDNRDFEHVSGIHSGELNILPDNDGIWRLLLGVRYVELSEDFYVRDVNRNDENSSHVKNKMIGFQLGARRDVWDYGDVFHLEMLVNGGVYRNRMTRNNRSGTISGGTAIDWRAEDNDIAFLGEAALTAVYHLNDCLAVRGGYQVLYTDGVMKGDDAIQGPGLITGSLFYHGLHVGLEYRR